MLYPPHDRYADFNRVAETVVYLLAVVVQGHYLEGYFLCWYIYRDIGSAGGLLCAQNLYVAALVELCARCRVHGCAERVYKVKAGVLKGTDVFAEQRKDKRLLRL